MFDIFVRFNKDADAMSEEEIEELEEAIMNALDQAEIDYVDLGLKG